MKCLAPWKALSVRFNGDIVPDCVYTGRHGNLHQNTLSEILEHPGLINTQQTILNNQLPKECSQCESKEHINNHSRRVFFDQILHHVPRTAEIDIRFLEINISNKCNLQCVMCSGVNSTAWVKLDNKLDEIDKSFKRPLNHPDFGYRIVKPNIIDKLFENPEYFKNLEYVNIKGGEPYMEADNIKLLEKLIDLNLHKQVTLDISTNGTVINEEFDRLALEFKTKWHISLEGVGKLYEYIRGGDNCSWEQFNDNLYRFDKFDRVIIAGTVMAYNVCHLNDVVEWFNRIKKSNYELYLNNTVTTPNYLNPGVLPNSILIGTGYKHDLSLAGTLPLFVKYTRTMDDIRGLDVLDVCPELRSIFS